MATTEQTPKSKRAHARQDKGCPVHMYDDRRCGRPIYRAPKGMDKEPVCLMHSHDPDKDNAAFQAEFERILDEAGDEGIADCSWFVFPEAHYGGREFKAKCVFFNATFTQADIFYKTVFINQASSPFRGATFAQDAVFWKATFTQAADFSKATFKRGADFREAKFLARVEFRESVFRSGEWGEPGPVFSGAEFQKPEEVTFYKTNLGQALFHNCDVSEFHFSDVTWRKRKGTSKSMVFDEVAGPRIPYPGPLGPKYISHEPHYRLIAELYQQLKKNY